MGSFRCGKCIDGYYGDQTVGCYRQTDQTICPDRVTICHRNATCVKRKGFANFVCECKIGWAGDGVLCGADSDLDGWCDFELACADKRCRQVTFTPVLVCFHTFTLCFIHRTTVLGLPIVAKKIQTKMELVMPVMTMPTTMEYRTKRYFINLDSRLFHFTLNNTLNFSGQVSQNNVISINSIRFHYLQELTFVF